MLAVAGTVPDLDFPLVEGEVERQGGHLLIAGQKTEINRGTPALLAAALAACQTLGCAPPIAILAGDQGLGQGSRLVYRHLCLNLARARLKVLLFHYLLPDVDWHNKVLFAVEEMEKRPVLMADAGFMYAAKMSGQAPEYDLFTPDAGELAFLADEEAPHPFYTRGFILHQDNQVPDLMARAYQHQNAARYLLVKGEVDYLASQGKILATVDSPREEALEAIGGTGDTLAGIVAALILSGRGIKQACTLGAVANRLAGHKARPDPATQVAEIITHIPAALAEVLSKAQGNPPAGR